MTKPITYTPELREEAVKLVLAQGLTLDEAAKRIAIPMGTLATWVKAAKLGNGAVTAPGSRTVPELEAEVVRLRRELAETRMERDIVKKAAAYFAQESLPNTQSRIRCDSILRLLSCAVRLRFRAAASMPGLKVSCLHVRRLMNA